MLEYYSYNFIGKKFYGIDIWDNIDNSIFASKLINGLNKLEFLCLEILSVLLYCNALT